MAQGINLLIGADVSKAVSELQKLNGFVSNWGSQIRGHIMGAFSLYAAYQGFRQTIQSINEFNASISELKALTGLAGQELETLRKNALNLAGAYRAVDIAKGQSELSRLGFSPEEIQQSIKAVTLLATATGTDLPKATEIAGSTLRAFGLDASQMQRVTDVMASSFNKTALDVTSFGEAMKYVAPNAAAANISLEETVAMLGTLANNGIKGSMAGTALRRIIQDLAGESGTLSEKFQKLNEKNITASYAFDEVGRIASTAFLILARGAKTTDELNEAFKRVNGETQKMADTMMDNVIGDWKKLNAEWDRVINDRSGPLTNFMRELLQNMEDQLAVLNSPTVTWWEKVFGSRDDYAEYAKRIKEMRELAPGSYLDSSGRGFKVGGAPPSAGTTAKPWYMDYLKIKEDVKPPLQEVNGLIPMLEDKMKALGEAMKKTWDGVKIRDYATQIEKIRDIIKQISEPIKENKDTIREKLNMRMGANFLYNFKVPSIEDMFLETPAPGPGKDEKGNRFDEAKQKALDRGQRIGRAFMMGFRSIVHGIADILVQAFTGENWWAGLMDVIGSVAIQLGTLIIGIGMGLEAVKEALEKPFGANPALAIAAGVALIGLGAALKAGAAAISRGNGGGGGSGGGQSNPRFADRELSLNGEWRIRGSDLVYVLDKQGYRSSTVGG